MARKQQRTKLKPFDIQAWIQMDEARVQKDQVTFLRIRNTLVEQNRPYAVKVAADFHRTCARHCDLQDLIQGACEGQTKAIERFNPRGSKTYKLEDFDPAKGGFTSYASRYIQAEQRKWSRKDRILYKPIHEDVPKALKAAYTDFEKANKRPPKAGEIPLPGNVSVARVARALEPNPVVGSFDVVVRYDGNREVTLHDMQADPSEDPETLLIRKENEFEEIEMLASLPRDEYLAVVGRVIEERSYSQIGRRIGGKSARDAQALVRQGLERLRGMK